MKIAIFGAGQLAMMMIQSDEDNEHEFLVIDPSDNPPASNYARHIKSEYTNLKTLEIVCNECDVATIDFENVDASAIKFLEDKISTYPNSKALEICQNRFDEKNFFCKLNIPVTEFHYLSKDTDEKRINEIMEKSDGQYIAKTCRFGYDGKGQKKITKNNLADIDLTRVNDNPIIIEKVVNFKSEVSLICVKTIKGSNMFYPLVENYHNKGILRTSSYPNNFESLQSQAEEIGNKVLNALNYVGVLVIEFFVDNENNLIANEMAPRVHNSGHWTIEGSDISQFKAHINAITGYEDFKIEKFRPTIMMNIISKHLSKDKIASSEHTRIYLHDYHKEERENRKLGHITIVFDNEKSFYREHQGYKDII